MAGAMQQRVLSGALATSSGSLQAGRRAPAPLPIGPGRRGFAVEAAAAPSTKERQAGASQVREGKDMIDVQPPRGTRDFAPDEYRLRQWLFGEFEAVSRLFGFEQFDTPVLESEELFVRKAGEEITQQLYSFEDKGGRRVALRPELTPSLARLVLQRGKALVPPVKWFTVGQCWRYERTTRGRRREHYQWNMDVIGVPGVAAEAELLSAITVFLERVGLSAADVAIRVSSRRVLGAVLARAGVPEDAFGPVCVVVDKLDKMPADKVEAELAALGLESEAIRGVLAATQLDSLEGLEQLLGPEDAAVAELRQLWTLAEAAGFAEYLVFDPSVVRGLAYYTGIVFEGRDRAGQLRAVFGGGRYDRLLQTLGGEAQPCAGFGFGDCVIQELLAERGLLPQLRLQVDDLVVAMNEDLRPQATKIAAQLRRQGRSVDQLLTGKKMKAVFKHAERCGAERLVLLAPDEWAQGLVRVKDLRAREERDVPVAEIMPEA